MMPVSPDSQGRRVSPGTLHPDPLGRYVKSRSRATRESESCANSRGSGPPSTKKSATDSESPKGCNRLFRPAMSLRGARARGSRLPAR